MLPDTSQHKRMLAPVYSTFSTVKSVISTPQSVRLIISLSSSAVMDTLSSTLTVTRTVSNSDASTSVMLKETLFWLT